MEPLPRERIPGRRRGEADQDAARRWSPAELPPDQRHLPWALATALHLEKGGHREDAAFTGANDSGKFGYAQCAQAR